LETETSIKGKIHDRNEAFESTGVAQDIELRRRRRGGRKEVIGPKKFCVKSEKGGCRGGGAEGKREKDFLRWGTAQLFVEWKVVKEREGILLAKGKEETII